MIELRGISKIYKSDRGEVVALDDLSLNFPATGLFTILGPSGSGKTTLLSIIGLLLSPTSGTVKINDEMINSANKRACRRLIKNKFSFVFQEFNLINELSVIDNVTLCGCTKKEAQEILVKLHILEYANSDVRFISGGEKQRVAIARGLAKNSSVFLVDEPGASLNEEDEIEVYELLKEISKDHLVITISHSEKLSRKYSDGTIRLEKGRVVKNDIAPIEEDEIPMEKTRANPHIKLSQHFKYFFNSKRRQKLLSLVFVISIAISCAIGVLGISLKPVTWSDTVKSVLAARAEDDNYLRISKGGSDNGFYYYQEMKSEKMSESAITAIDLVLDDRITVDALIVGDDDLEDGLFSYGDEKYAIGEDIIITDYLADVLPSDETLNFTYPTDHENYRILDRHPIVHPLSPQLIDTPYDGSNRAITAVMKRILVPEKVFLSDLRSFDLALMYTKPTALSDKQSFVAEEVGYRTAAAGLHVTLADDELKQHLDANQNIVDGYEVPQGGILVSNYYWYLLKLVYGINKDISFRYEADSNYGHQRGLSISDDFNIIGVYEADGKEVVINSSDYAKLLSHQNIAPLSDHIEAPNDFATIYFMSSSYTIEYQPYQDAAKFHQQMSDLSKVMETVSIIFLLSGFTLIGYCIYHEVRDKRHQIATFKSLGIRSSQIFGLYLINSFIISFSALAAGAVLGYLATPILNAICVNLAASLHIATILCFDPIGLAPVAVAYAAILMLPILVATISIRKAEIAICLQKDDE